MIDCAVAVSFPLGSYLWDTEGGRLFCPLDTQKPPAVELASTLSQLLFVPGLTISLSAAAPLPSRISPSRFPSGRARHARPLEGAAGLRSVSVLSCVEFLERI